MVYVKNIKINLDGKKDCNNIRAYMRMRIRA